MATVLMWMQAVYSHRLRWLAFGCFIWCVMGLAIAKLHAAEPVIKVPAASAHNAVRAALSQQATLNNLGFRRDSSYNFSLQPEPATPLPNLVDSSVLQDAAAVHAESCVFEHRDNAYGENLFAITGSDWTVEHAVSSWAYEVIDYDYANLSCTPGKVCGHYTQMVADNISAVGCAIQQCSPITEAGGSPIFDGRSGLMIACYYDKIGNINGQPPYVAKAETELAVKVKVMLQGAYLADEGMMRLSPQNRQLPLAEPYSQLGHNVAESTSLNPTLLQQTDANAIVDWVLVELRDATAPANILATKALLLQRDGDVVSPGDGSEVLRFAGYSAGAYHIAVRHYNHLGVMTAQALSLSSEPVTIDFSQPASSVWGEYARFSIADRALLWAGDSNHDGRIIGDGVANDGSILLETVLLSAANTGLSVNYIAEQDNATDLNMDGKTIFAGVNNDTNMIRANVLLHPANTLTIGNFIVPQQLP